LARRAWSAFSASKSALRRLFRMSAAEATSNRTYRICSACRTGACSNVAL
jgi:hypothetical protein